MFVGVSSVVDGVSNVEGGVSRVTRVGCECDSAPVLGLIREKWPYLYSQQSLHTMNDKFIAWFIRLVSLAFTHFSPAPV